MDEEILDLVFRGAKAGKASKAWALSKFWVLIRSYKKQLVKKIGVVYWASPWRPWVLYFESSVLTLRQNHLD